MGKVDRTRITAWMAIEPVRRYMGNGGGMYSNRGWSDRDIVLGKLAEAEDRTGRERRQLDTGRTAAAGSPAARISEEGSRNAIDAA